jgi:hypothetical protein
MDTTAVVAWQRGRQSAHVYAYTLYTSSVDQSNSIAQVEHLRNEKFHRLALCSHAAR